MSENDEWLNNDNFKKFLEDYIEVDTYSSITNEDLKAYITYRSLYHIYNSTLKSKSITENLQKEFAKILETLERVDTETIQLIHLIEEQKKSRKGNQGAFIVLIILAILSIYNTLVIILKSGLA